MTAAESPLSACRRCGCPLAGNESYCSHCGRPVDGRGRLTRALAIAGILAALAAAGTCVARSRGAAGGRSSLTRKTSPIDNSNRIETARNERKNA
jgi:hypothetical protein